jgi:hypothetical protein
MFSEATTKVKEILDYFHINRSFMDTQKVEEKKSNEK